jgi:hypothetical protein
MLWHVDGGECPICRGAGGFRWHEADGSENGQTCPCSGRVPDWTPKPWAPRGAVPVLTDGPTKGALLEAVREAWGDPYMLCAPSIGLDLFPTTWAVIDRNGQRVTQPQPSSPRGRLGRGRGVLQ